MKVEVQELDGCRRALAVETPQDVVQAAWEEALGRVQRQARLPGFRKGRVPRHLIRLHFADEVRREVAERLIPDIYRRAVAEAGLRPVEEPELRDLVLAEDQPLRFTAAVEVKPAITLGAYQGVEVEHAPQPLTDADVEAALQALAEQQAELRAVGRPARDGDQVIVDYAVTPEGAEPREEQGYAFPIGQGRVLPEMEEAVVGLGAGDEREVAVRFPETHPREELRGKAGHLRLRVVEVKEKWVPAVDDDLARGLGSYQGLDDLRAAVRKELEAQRESENRRELEAKVVDAALAGHDFAVPEAMVHREISHRLGHARERLRRDGIDPDALPWDYAKLTEELRPSAARAVQRALLLEAVAEAEGLTVPDEELDAEVARIARESNRNPQAVRSLLERGGELEGLRHAMREARALAFLVEHARIRSGDENTPE